MQTNTPSNFTLADGAGHTFLCDKPSLRRVDQMVVRQPASMPRSASLA